MQKKVYLTITSDTKRVPNKIIHYATVHDLDGQLCVSATLDHVMAVAEERGYVFIGEYPVERRRITNVLVRKERNWEQDAARNDYERGLS